MDTIERLRGDNMEELDIYSVGEAASISGLSSSTLRYYDSINLVVPESRGSENNYRYYTRDQVVTLCVIQRLKGLGCGIQDIKAIIEAGNLETIRQTIMNSNEAITQKIEELQEALRISNEYLERLNQASQIINGVEDGGTLSEFPFLNDPKIEKIPQSYIFFNTQVIVDYDNSKTSVKFWRNLYTKCENCGYKIIGSGIVVYNTELLGQFIVRDCKISLGLQVENVPASKDITVWGGFTAATAIHIGPYNQILNTYLSLTKWLNKEGYEVCGEAAEEFVLSPIDTYSQKFQVAKVILPIKKKGKR